MGEGNKRGIKIEEREERKKMKGKGGEVKEGKGGECVGRGFFKYNLYCL